MKIGNQSRYWLLAVGCWLLAIGAWAQQKNVLSVPDAKVSIGLSQLPVAIENTDEIIAAQFDLTLPSTISAGTDAVLTNRCDGHTAIIRKMEATRYRVMLYSDENRPLLAQQGTVLYVPLNIPQTVKEGSELPLVISNATLTVAGGANVLTDTKAGKLIVSLLPDLTVKAVAVTASDGSPVGTVTITPGERLSLSWQVQNVGGTPTTGGWTEQILLVNKRSTVTKLMGTTYCQETLDAGATVSRQADITVPQLLGIEGEAYVQVHVVANSDTGESSLSTGNNTAQSVETFTVSKRLFVEPTPATVPENYGRNIAVKVSRSGDWSGDQTFTLSATEDSRVQGSLPPSVTIPSGQSGAIVFMSVTDNKVLDDNNTIVITAKGNNYPDATGTVIIEDNEFPDLMLTASKSLVTEGETFLLTVTTSRAVEGSPLDITLTSENAKRFSFPQTVTIPVGETSVTVDVTAIDDEMPDLELSTSFTATAPAYNKAEAIILLEDDDLPEIQLVLTPAEISEGAGPQSVTGIVRRLTNIDKRITIKLSDDAPAGTLFYTTPTIEMLPGVEEIQFTMGPVDNSTVDGERTYNVTAATYVSSCSCTVGSNENSIGSVKAQLTILDDDGPTLWLTPSATVVKEGGKLTLNIARNTSDVSQPLTVQLSSTYDDNLQYDETVTIPVGKSSVDVVVTSLRNDVSGDNVTVSFTASAEGFTRATCWFMVTDQTKPDAIVKEVSLSQGEVCAGSYVDVNVTVENIGFATLQAPVKVAVYTGLSSSPVTTLYYNENIEAGAQNTLTGSFTVPKTVAKTYVYAVVSVTQDQAELFTTNNTSDHVSLNIVAPYSTVVQTDKAVYDPGANVTISGQLAPANEHLTVGEKEVEVYVVYNGYRQTISAVTDGDGRFETVYTPLESQTGHFTVGACYPGENKKDELAGFDIYGIRPASYNYIKVECAVGDTYKLDIPLVNPCAQPLTGITATVTKCPENCDISLSVPSVAEAGTKFVLHADITGSQPSEEQKWFDIGIRVQTAEGAVLDIPVYYYCASQKAVLAIVGDQSPNLTLPEGYVTEYSLTITNKGKGETGVVTLAMPDVSWLKLATPTSMASMAQNDSTTIVFLMTTEGLNLNVDSYATVGINCENGNGTYIRLNVTPVSTAMGTLHIVVGDEFTYNTAEAPFVAGASVTLRNPTTHSVVASGVTNSAGVFETEINAGYYTMTVSADKHDTYSSTVYVMADRVNNEDIFLPYQSITIDWTVERTTVEDEYKVVVTADYEVNVPAPVVVWTFPDKIPDEDHIFYVSCINKGKMPAYGINVTIPESDKLMTFIPLGPTHYDVLTPEAGLVFPVQAKKNGSGGSGGSGDPNNPDGPNNPDDPNNPNNPNNPDDPNNPNNPDDPNNPGGGDPNTPGGGDSGDPNDPNGGGSGDPNGGETGDPTNPGGGSGDPTNPGGGSGNPNTPGGGYSIPCYTRTYSITVEDKERVCVGGEWVEIPKTTTRTYTEQVGDCPTSGGGGGGGVSRSVGGGGGGGYGGFLGGPGGGGGSYYGGGGGGGRITTPVKNCNPCVPNILHRLADCLGQWVPYYECAKEAYKEFRDNGDGTKTVVCIIKESIPGMNCASDAFTCGAGAALNELDDEEGYECFNDIVSDCYVEAIKEDVPIISWIWKAKRCWDFLNAPCGSKIDGPDWARRAELSEENEATSSVTPSFVKAFYENTRRAMDATEAMHNIFVDHYGDEMWTESPRSQLQALRMAELRLPKDASLQQMHEVLDQYRPENITKALFDSFVERIYNTRLINKGETVNSDNHIHKEVWEEAFAVMAEAQNYAIANGYQTVGEQYEDECNIFLEKLNEHSEAVCATITLKIEQKVTMTREAFRGTLSVDNGNETTAMKNVKLNLQVTDKDGNLASSHEFQINCESVTGFEGEADLQSGWTLGANEKGVATILFIPTKYAAPTEPVEWAFGGTLSYIDPYTGLEVTRELTPVTLTVNPSPNLDMTYFLQRDVYGDDPLTDPIEPSVDAEFALLINNTGYGDATNVRIVTAQPEIISNERNVKIDFELVSSQLNGEEKTMALGQSITNDFGTIPAGTTAYAQWWLRCDMLGHFVNYNVEATHVTSYGNPDLSLLGDVTIHELIHSLEVTKDDATMRGFMVNDIADANDYPDALYLTNGERQAVAVATSVKTQRLSSTECLLTVTPGAAGWNYGNCYDPAHGLSTVKSIVRQSDGKEIPLQNIWQTDRTLRDGLEPLYEYRLHLAVDFAAEATETFVVTFNPSPDVLLAVNSIDGIPAEGRVVFDPLDNITVNFSKVIDPETFTTDDLSIGIQGEKQDVSEIGISSTDNKTFTLDMSKFSEQSPNGYYLLTVQTADITDFEGYQGRTGKTAGWLFYRDGFVRLLTSAYPVNSGEVERSVVNPAGSRRMERTQGDDNTAEYGATVVLKALPATGYVFTNWTLNGKVVSTNDEYETLAVSDMDVVANFSKQTYNVEVETIQEGGVVKGDAAGIYEYGTQMTFTAVPDEDYAFAGWMVNGEMLPNANTSLAVTVNEAMAIKARFVREFYRQTLSLTVGWSWMSTYLLEPQPVGELANRVNRIVGQFDELILDPEYGLVGDVSVFEPGAAYKVQSMTGIVSTFRGHLMTSPIVLRKGWNWVAYPWMEERLVATTLTNAEEGDFLVSQKGFTEYADGYWEGNLAVLTPGRGYMYKSASNKTLAFAFTEAASRSLAPAANSQQPTANSQQPTAPEALMSSYPSTMNITARLYHEGMELTGGNYLLYAMNGDEIRGVGEHIGNNYYVTVYGDLPVDISFVVENTGTGETFMANETLKFHEDVVGSRKQPFAISFGETTGIVEMENGKWKGDNPVYDLQGRRVNHAEANYSLFTIHSSLRKGVYIVNGHKVVNGKYVK